jgi:hypothetical protein
MAKFKTRQDFDAHLAKVQADREQFVKKEREALGRAAEKAGVLELGFTEEQLEQAFEKMVRECRASPVQAPTAKRRAGAAAELETSDAK